MVSTQTVDDDVMLSHSASGLTLAATRARRVLPAQHDVFRFDMLR